MIRTLLLGAERRVTASLLVCFAVAGCSSATPKGQTTDGAGSGSGGSASGSSASGSGAGGAGSQGGAPLAGTSAVAGSSGSAAGGSSGAAGSATGGAPPNSGGSSSLGGGPPTAACDTPGLTWKTARKTWYESYPDPGSEECVKYNGCMWAGQFAACQGKKPESWVKERNIVAAFPGFESLALHDLCLKSGDKTIVVTVLDTCGDDDCDGCCTTNQGSADALIDLEKYTNERWGVQDGQITWADLGPTSGTGCD